MFFEYLTISIMEILAHVSATKVDISGSVQKKNLTLRKKAFKDMYCN